MFALDWHQAIKKKLALKLKIKHWRILSETDPVQWWEWGWRWVQNNNQQNANTNILTTTTDTTWELMCSVYTSKLNENPPFWEVVGDWGIPWWRHQMETFSASLALCAGHSPVTSEFPVQRTVTRSFDVLFDLHLNKQLSKQSWGWWSEMPSHTLWRHCNDIDAVLGLGKYCGRMPW